jgi:hypothetical protein
MPRRDSAHLTLIPFLVPLTSAPLFVTRKRLHDGGVRPRIL